MIKHQIIETIREISNETRVLIREFSDKKKGRNDLETAYVRLNEIFNKAMDAVMVISKDYSVVRVNDNMARLTGHSQEDIEEKKCYEVFGDANCLTSNCPLDRIQRGEDTVEIETEKKIHDGSKMTCLVSAVPLKSSDGDLTGIVKTIKDITRRKKAEERINYLAHHDHLTGLPNRMCFLDRLCLEIAHAKRNKKILAVLFIDLDGFKSINDTLGHDVGDLYLVEAANRLLSVARESDTVGRIGGDEFTVLLTSLGRQKDAVTFAKRLIAAFEEPWEFNGQKLSISASIGLALYPGDGDNPYTLLKKADQAMYRAKKEGTIFQFYNYYLNENEP